MTEGDTFAISTLGCKLNFSESGSIADQLIRSGCRRVPFNESADIYLINTCTVTGNADRKCRYAVRRARKQNSDAIVVVTGCYAQLRPDEVSNMGADFVLGNGEKVDVVQYLKNRKNAGIFVNPISKATFMPSFTGNDRTRSFLKVQDGCDYQCAYCTIPAARGNGRCGDPEMIIHHAEELAAKGIREIVLTGVNIGTYKHDDTGFLQLLRHLERVKDILRFRISSIEPNLVTDDIIHFIASSEKFVPHFHIPMQSGCDKLLKSMGRLYDCSVYAGRIERIMENIPDAAIGADVIVGLPGEDDERFRETKNFITSLGLSYLHVFPYSPRPRTRAERMPEQVSHDIRRQRADQLRALSDRLQSDFCRRFDGVQRMVLFEGKTENNFRNGLTDNYIKVKASKDVRRNDCHWCTLHWDEKDKAMRAIVKDQTLKTADHVPNTV